MSQRSYRQICGVAQALDLVGERWTLLVLRELLLGPKRFGALREALPGLGPNLLSARLQALTDAGIVERVELPPPARVPAYALTPRGEALRPVVEALAVWGFELLAPARQLEQGWPARASWYAFTLAAAAAQRGTLRDEPRLVVNFDIDGDKFVIRTDGKRAHVRHGAAEHADAELHCDLTNFDALIHGQRTADDPAVAALLQDLSPARQPTSA